MTAELFILVEGVAAPDDSTFDSTMLYSEPRKGSGYHLGDGTHTVMYRAQDFEGVVAIQGTLAEHPGEDDWVDIKETEFQGDGSTIHSATFFGNWVWIRARYQLYGGVIDQIAFTI